MMPWIAISREIGNDPKTHALAEATGLDVDAAIGKLVRLFGAVAEHAPDGQLGAVPATTLEVWANWHGKRGRFATAFLAGFTRDGLLLAWEKYNGAKIRKAERDRQRLRQQYAADTRPILAADDGESRGNLARETGENRAMLAGNKDKDSTEISTGKTPLTQEPTNTHDPDAPAAHEPAGFAEAWAALPKRPGSNPRRRAANAFRARLKDGVTADAMRAGAERYAAFCRATGIDGTPFVQQGQRFFGPECEFLNAWTPDEKPRTAPVVVPIEPPRILGESCWPTPEGEAYLAQVTR